MKKDVAQPLSMGNGNDVFNIEQDQCQKRKFFEDLCQSFNFTYLTHKWFDDKRKHIRVDKLNCWCFFSNDLDWKLAFCSSSFNCINRYPNIFLVYRTILFFLTIVAFIHSIVDTRPVHEWVIYCTHWTLLVTFLAVVFQFLITYRANFYRGNSIVPRNSLQCVHLLLIVVSLGSGLVVSLLYWSFINNPPMPPFHLQTMVDHGVLWFLLFIDVLVLTRLPIYMIDCVPTLIFSIIYGMFTIIIFICKLKFSNDRIGYVYWALNLNNASIRILVYMFFYMFILPVVIIFILWNICRLRRSIQLQTKIEQQESELNVMNSI